MRSVFLFFVLLSFSIRISAQDTISVSNSGTVYKPSESYRFKAKALIIPSALILYGATGLLDNSWNTFNLKIQEKVVNDWNNPFHSTHLDDYLVAIPALSVYGLNMVGIEGKHNFIDRSIIIGVSGVVAYASVTGLKSLTHNLRPDGSSYDSWPSGHTALAFAGAEFLYQEYKDRSIWYGISGYAVATTVGVLRVYNNRHWVTDVAAGAGIGILSTKLAYWIFPAVSRTISRVIKPKNGQFATIQLTPNVYRKSIGFNLVVLL